MSWLPRLDLAGIATLLLVAVTLVTFLVASHYSRKRDREAANREIYQRLELASIELFRFEADHVAFTRPLWEESTPLPAPDSAERNSFDDYVCQMLNLFEMAIRFREEKVMPAPVLGSWVIWYYELCTAPHFKDVWEKVRWNYTSDLRNILDEGVWLAKDEPDETVRKRKFFSYVGDLLGCDAVRGWPSYIEQEARLLHEKKGHQADHPRAVGVKAGDSESVAVSWCEVSDEASRLVDFFMANVDLAYISHSEVQLATGGAVS